MEKQNNYQERFLLANRIAAKMAELASWEVDKPQSRRYEDLARQYIQTNVDAMYPDEPENTHSMYHHG